MKFNWKLTSGIGFGLSIGGVLAALNAPPAALIATGVITVFLAIAIDFFLTVNGK